MNDVVKWTETERLGVADLLESLSDDEWSVDSLCTGWTVRHVAAHLTMSTRTTWSVALKGAIRARGSFDRMADNLARDRAARFEPAELIAQIRETAASPRRAPGAGLLDPLLDTLVHGQDIARPLGHPRPVPLEPALAALAHACSSNFYGARKRFRGLTLIATDADWTSGTGPDEVRAPVSDLLLLATGRPAGLAAASGPGVARLAL
ncbi:maleylpyruvate isomerase family mycothiol-dependent enzyme [Kribbella sancticallisti]|uniref:Maleylpyruvate isomerase family mycothiol-dependent enzyme n=1 Tax=Kribbella sancticallisti TaxID=460087 RepID=A0ABN2EK13_9ACTN